MKKTLAILMFLSAMHCHAQPGSLQSDSLLQYINRYHHLGSVYLTPKSYASDCNLPSFIYGVPYHLFSQVDSIYHYYVDNGQRSSRTEKWIFENDSIVKYYNDIAAPVFNTSIYSKKWGLAIRWLDEHDRISSEYFYDEHGGVDSVARFYYQPGQDGMIETVPSSCTKDIIELEGQVEKCTEMPSGHLKYIRTYDAEGQIICEIAPNSNGIFDSLNYAKTTFEWQNGFCIQQYKINVKKNKVTFGYDQQWVNDELGLVKKVYQKSYETEDIVISPPSPPNSGTSVSYEIVKNEKGQVIVKNAFGDFSTTYVFDERGNWTSKIGTFQEHHRTLFYKKQ